MADNVRFDEETGDYIVDMDLDEEEIDTALMMVPTVLQFVTEKGDSVMSKELKEDMLKALNSDTVEERLRGVINTCIVAMLHEEEEGLFDNEGHTGKA